MADEMKREYIAVTEIAKTYGKTKQAIFQMAKRKSVPMEKIGNIVVIKRENVGLLGYWFFLPMNINERKYESDKMDKLVWEYYHGIIDDWSDLVMKIKEANKETA